MQVGLETLRGRAPLLDGAAWAPMWSPDLTILLRTAFMSDVLEISATEFEAKCLSIFKELEARRYQKVVVTRRGKAIAELTAAKPRAFDLYGCMKGSVIIPPEVDLTRPVLEDIPDAERGILHR
jgi:antitoxin (DNA-binding transcriptional repressor) of toxin-antitoxin stability system